MVDVEPIQFEPLFMERVWGGRELEKWGRPLPAGSVIGESWELVDRPEAQSVVATGSLVGRTIHELWTNHREEIFGEGLPESERFPLLIKLLDARERLSLQVHPPATIASTLGGEPKTECWYLLDNGGEGEIFAGFKQGADKEQFQVALADGTVEELAHRIRMNPGECIFIPSGRLHAIGAGCVILETQQNSDTTYRVFDWNRVGLDGKPRALHVEESLASIDFTDFEPAPQPTRTGRLVECDHFLLDHDSISAGDSEKAIGTPGRFALLFVLEGELRFGGKPLGRGAFVLLPKNRQLAQPGPQGSAFLIMSLP